VDYNSGVSGQDPKNSFNSVLLLPEKRQNLAFAFNSVLYIEAVCS
jgi:hypothetical protein